MMGGAAPQGLLDITIRGWFWKAAEPLNLEAVDIGYLTQKHKGKFGTIPSLDESLQDCVLKGKRTVALDGSLRAVIALGYGKTARIRPLLIDLVYELDKRFPVPLPVLQARLLDLLPCSDQTRDLLNSMVRFGALNVTYFEDTPPQLRLTEIKNRCWAILNDPDRKDSCEKASAPVTSRCGRVQMATMSQGVLGAKGGVCTTFAATAVDLLLNDAARKRACRIEFVSGPKHCLCLLNREISAKDTHHDTYDVLVRFQEWNEDVVIIDPWAGAMGYHVISTIETYPACLKSMIGLGLKKFYDSEWG